MKKHMTDLCNEYNKNVDEIELNIRIWKFQRARIYFDELLKFKNLY